jgi:solute carrier family 13 (sodium-dependent dicarboxylate transporter), member 2/3/5
MSVEATSPGGRGASRRWRERSGLLLAPAAFVIVWFAPLGVNVPAHRLAAILATVIVLWVTEAIPMAITAFLGVASAVALGVAPAGEAFAPFADPLIFVFVGTFMLARAIFVHGLDRRFAFAILGVRGVGDHPGRVLAAYAAVCCAVSMWISNTATVAMMFPIGLSLLAALESHGSRAVPPGYAAALLLANAFAASIGGLATPVGTPPNLIGIGFIRRYAEVDLSFFTWMAFGLPVTCVLLGAVIVILTRGGVTRGGAFGGVAALVARERALLGPWSRGERNTMLAFGLTVFFWVLPGLVELVAGESHPFHRALQEVLPEGVVALFGASLLFLLPVSLKRFEFTLGWDDAVQIDWWIVFLYGGGIALGTLAFKTGLAEALGRSLTGVVGVRSGFGLLLVSTALATVLSETTSNTAAANMVVPVVIALAHATGTDPVPPALGATMGASLGFMLPVSTPCNAIVYGSGRIPLTTMLRYGVVLDLAGIIAIVTVVSTLAPWLLGADAR